MDPSSQRPAEGAGTLRPGARLDRYLVLREAGRGGMGTIWEARDTVLRRVVALKVMPPEWASRREHRERFLREAQAAAKIRHRNVVAVHDVGVGELVYIVMELLEGETFEALLRREAPLSFGAALEHLLPVMSAVAAAHECRVVHRDLKPSNVMLARERDGAVTPKVLDFGISKVSRVTREFRAVSPRDLELTDREAHLGTPNYMAPEQDGSNHAVGPWSDCWALAVMLYRAVTGRLPFTARSAVELTARKRIGRFDPPSGFPFGLPPLLDAWMARALAPDPSARYGSVRAMARDLLAFAPDATRARWEPAFDAAHDPPPPRPDTVPPALEVTVDVPVDVPAAHAAPSPAAPADPSPPPAAPSRAAGPLSRRERALAAALALSSAAAVALGLRELARPAAAPAVTAARPLVAAPLAPPTPLDPRWQTPATADTAAPPSPPPPRWQTPATAPSHRRGPREAARAPRPAAPATPTAAAPRTGDAVPVGDGLSVTRPMPEADP